VANPDLDEPSIHLGISKNQVSLGAVVRHAAPLILAQMLAALTGRVLLFNSEPMASHADPIAFSSRMREASSALVVENCGASSSSLIAWVAVSTVTCSSAGGDQRLTARFYMHCRVGPSHKALLTSAGRREALRQSFQSHLGE